MYANPKIGDRVRLNYKNKAHPLQGAEGFISLVSNGKPRNHMVTIPAMKINDTPYYEQVVVPCGNINKVSQ